VVHCHSVSSSLHFKGPLGLCDSSKYLGLHTERPNFASWKTWIFSTLAQVSNLKSLQAAHLFIQFVQTIWHIHCHKEYQCLTAWQSSVLPADF